MCGLVAFVTALTINLPFISACSCYAGQKPGPDPDPSGYNRYHWALQGAASTDPCGCTAFELGGVNAVPIGDHARPFNVSDLGKTSEEIRRTLGCQADGIFVTNVGESILFPLDPFTTTTLSFTFELYLNQMGFTQTRARVYLAAFPQATAAHMPPYMIEIMAAQMTIQKLDPSTSTSTYYALLTSDIEPQQATPQFHVSYEYLARADLDTPRVKIMVTSGTDTGSPAVYATDTNGQAAYHVGIASTGRAEWKFLDA